MDGVGRILRDTRESRKIALDQIEDATKINKRYLAAMEDEDWARLPGEVYARGFLRTYSRCLNLDEDSMIDLYELSLTMQGSEKGAQAGQTDKKWWRRKPRKPAEADLYSKASKQSEVDLHDRPKKKMVLVMCLLSVAVLAFAVWAFRVYYLEPLEEERTLPPQIIQPLPQPVQPTVPAVSEPDPVPESVAWTAFLVKIEALADCWMRIRDSGELVFEGTMPAGTEREFFDLEAVEIHVGNAGGIVLTLNGTELPALGGSGQVVTRRFIIEDGAMIDEDTGESIED